MNRPGRYIIQQSSNDLLEVMRYGYKGRPIMSFT